MPSRYLCEKVGPLSVRRTRAERRGGSSQQNLGQTQYAVNMSHNIAEAVGGNSRVGSVSKCEDLFIVSRCCCCCCYRFIFGGILGQFSGDFIPALDRILFAKIVRADEMNESSENPDCASFVVRCCCCWSLLPAVAVAGTLAARSWLRQSPAAVASL